MIESDYDQALFILIFKLKLIKGRDRPPIENQV
jgi:hypothetical protein